MKSTINYRRAAVATAALALATTNAIFAAAPPPSPRLGIPGSERTAEVKLDAFAGLPPPQPYGYRAPAAAGKVLPGIDGLKLPDPPHTSGSATLAILGDLGPIFPGNLVSEKYLKSAVGQLNLLRPDLVLTVGNLSPSVTRNGARWVDGVANTRTILETLKMPWYPCAGETDVSSATGQADSRFEGLYRKHQGPLYYSIDTGDAHVVVLNSEEFTEAGAREEGIGDAQFAWLKADLNRVFNTAGAARARWVVVIVHRALWRTEEKAGPNGWKRVHAFFDEFNRKPIVTMEGNGPADKPGPRVVAVIAGGERAYSLEPTRDDIRYFVMGPTSAMARAGEDSTAALRGMLLLKLEPDNAKAPAGTGVHAALVHLGGTDTEPIAPDDSILANERGIIDTIATWNNDIIGIDGFIDQRPPPAIAIPATAPAPSALRVHMKDPLTDPIDLSMRIASAKNMGGANDPRRESANTLVEGFDLPWELSTRHILRHLEPAITDGWAIDLSRPEDYIAGTSDAPPQVEFLMHWLDPRGHGHQVLLKRRVPVAALAQVPVSTEKGEALWNNATSGGAYAWEIRGDEPRKLNPTWQMATDGERVLLRVTVEDSIKSYWPRMTLDPTRGGLMSDAVSIAWAHDTKSPNESVQRIWVLPFAPKGPELWTNTNIGDKQTPLLQLDPKIGITAQLENTSTGYEATLSLPRALIFGELAPATLPAALPAPATATAPATTSAATTEATTTTAPATTTAATKPIIPMVPVASAILNISVHDNDEGPRTFTRSWSKEDLGPAGWGKVELMKKAIP